LTDNRLLSILTAEKADVLQLIGMCSLMLHYKTYETADTQAPWVVFVHGAGGSSSIWFLQIRAFMRHFNVLLIDLRGHGESRHLVNLKEDCHYNFEDITRDIIEVLDTLKIKKAHFVGISLGTILIRNLSEIASERVSSMIMGGAIIRLNIRAKVLVAIGNGFKRFVPYMWLYRFFAWIIMPRERHKKSRLLFVNEAKKVAQKEFMRWFRLTYEVTPLLKYFNEKDTGIPTLYLMGDEDHMFLPAVRQIVTRHTNSWLEVIENSGHVCNVDQPRKFNDHAIAFLKRMHAASTEKHDIGIPQFAACPSSGSY
jgi:pimeloyl-ACP methyl ester carboxylesterase